MEFYGYGFADSSPSSATTVSSFLTVCLETCKQLTFKKVFGNIISVVFCLFFGIVGTLFGAINGAIICQQSEKSYFRGAAIGAVSGALLSIEVFKTFLRLWLSGGKGFQCLLYLADVLISLVNGKIIGERVGAVLINHRRPSQTSIGTETGFEGYLEDKKCKGLSANTVDKIPRVDITSENHADSCGQNISCSVCLEDFQVGEDARRLPFCDHMFHPGCIDQWLIKRGSCPLCRRKHVVFSQHQTFL